MDISVVISKAALYSTNLCTDDCYKRDKINATSDLRSFIFGTLWSKVHFKTFNNVFGDTFC